MTILPQVEEQLRQAAARQAQGRRVAWGRRPSWRGSRRAVAARAVAATVLASLLVFALADGGGRRQFDVVAAVYHALPLGPGVLYTVTEEQDGINGLRERTREERWRTSTPPRERSVGRVQRSYGNERVWFGESAIAPGGMWSSWSTFRPGVIEHTKARGILKAVVAGVDPDMIRAAYQSGALRLVGKGEFEGSPVYRLKVDRSRCRSCRTRPGGMMVDAHTFLPIDVEWARDRQGRRVPRFVMRYLVYKELPLTRANLALLAMRPHPGTRVLERR